MSSETEMHYRLLFGENHASVSMVTHIGTSIHEMLMNQTGVIVADAFKSADLNPVLKEAIPEIVSGFTMSKIHETENLIMQMRNLLIELDSAIPRNGDLRDEFESVMSEADRYV